MKIEEILNLESQRKGLMLVRDRLFWQAWEYSAFLFVNHLRPYRIHRKIIKKVGEEVVWLGFPRTSLELVIADAVKLGGKVTYKDDDCVLLEAMPALDGFEQWKITAGAPPVSVVPVPASPIVAEPKASADTFLPAYRQAYDLALFVHRASGKISRNYRYSLGEKICNEATGIVEILQCVVESRGVRSDLGKALDLGRSLRLHLRLLKDLQQLPLKTWGYLNQQLENFFHLIWPEFRSTQSTGVMPC